MEHRYPVERNLQDRLEEVRETSPLRRGVDDVVRHIQHSLLSDALGEDGSLGDVEVKSSILLEDVLEVSQDLKRHAHLGFYVTIISISKRSGLRVLCERTSP